jgi:hypothetical protein
MVAEGKARMNKIKPIALVLLSICIILSASLVSEMLSYQALKQQEDEEYRKLYFQLIDEVRIAYDYYENWTRWKKAELNQTEIYPEDQQDFIDHHSELIKSILNGYDPHKLETLVMHACIKTDSNISLPDVAHTYKQLQDGFAPYEVLILPEYDGNLDWTETLQWISTDFTEVPICLSVFEGGNESFPDPNVNLGIEEIDEAMASSDVRMVRFAEMISWYLTANETQPQPFPLDEVRNVLEFCQSKNIKVLWNEWKISDDVLPTLKNIIDGYEDTVTVIYQTNNEFDAVFVGYLYATQFGHWGESVQSWWVDDKGNDLSDLPLETVVEYAKLARNMGAEIIQFEPYWYFFDNGEPLEPMYAIWSAI